MNLRISENQLRFRITRDECEELLQGRALTLLLPLQRGGCRVEAGAGATPLALHEETDRLTLIVSRDALEELHQQLPSREGIEYKENTLQLALEVDVRKSPKL